MKKVLKNTLKNKQWIDKLEKVYLVGFWAKYGVREYPWSGKWLVKDFQREPLVYDYDDHNGTSDCYYLKPLHSVTTGGITTWTFYKESAIKIAEALNTQQTMKSDNATLPHLGYIYDGTLKGENLLAVRSFDVNTAIYIKHSLLTLKQKTDVPGCIYKLWEKKLKGKTEKEIYEAAKIEWLSILDVIIRGFHTYANCQGDFESVYGEEAERERADFKAALRLFTKYYEELWY